MLIDQHLHCLLVSKASAFREWFESRGVEISKQLRFVHIFSIVPMATPLVLVLDS